MYHHGNPNLPSIVLNVFWEPTCYHGIPCTLYQFINYKGPGSKGCRIEKYTGVIEIGLFGDSAAFHGIKEHDSEGRGIHLCASPKPGDVYRRQIVWLEKENDDLASFLLLEKCNFNTKAWDSEKHRIHHRK